METVKLLKNNLFELIHKVACAMDINMDTGYEKSILSANIKRLFWACTACSCIILFLALNIDGKITGRNYFDYYIYIILLGIFLILPVAALSFGKNFEKKYKAVNLICNVTALIILCGGAFLSSSYILRSNSILLYIAAMAIVAFLLYLKPGINIVNFAVSLLIFIISVRYSETENADMLLMMCSALFASMVMLFISVVKYKNKAAKLINLKMIADNEMEIINLKSELKKFVTRDSLTNLMNRAQFDEALIKEWNRAKRENSQITLLMLDIDDFTKYNEIYGYTKGDESIKRIADILNNVVKKKTSYVARYASDSFTCILPCSSRIETYAMCEQIRQNIREEAIEHSGVKNFELTASFSLVHAKPKMKDSMEFFVEAAEKALQEAKKNGKDKIEIGLFW